MSSLVFNLVFSLGSSLRIYSINSQNTMRNTLKRYEKCTFYFISHSVILMIYSWLLCNLWEYEKWKWKIISSGAASLNILYSAGHAQLTIPINPSPLIISFCNVPLWYIPSILFTFGSFSCFPSILSSCLFLPVVFFSSVIRL